jgi:hypothetical protein
MTAGARVGLRIDIPRMRLVATDARRSSVVKNAHVGVTARARVGRLHRRVRFMATGADRVDGKRCGEERRLDAVTPHAPR